MTSPKSILVATDFSPASEHTVTYALELGASLGSKVYVLHVCEPPDDAPAHVRHELPTVDLMERDTLKRLDAVVKAQPVLPEALEQLVEFGEAAEEIARVAGRLRAELVIVGNHGFTGLPRVLLGSVAEAVLRSAPCPVLVVRRPDKRKNER